MSGERGKMSVSLNRLLGSALDARFHENEFLKTEIKGEGGKERGKIRWPAGLRGWRAKIYAAQS